MNVTPKRPYLLRAFYEWIVDNGMTPHILVDAHSAQVSVPRQYVKDGSIILNVSPTAANQLMMRDDEVTFNARFSGKSFPIYLPIWAVMAIYAKETQDGISFPADEYEELEQNVTQEAGKVPPVLTAITGKSDTQAEEPTDLAVQDDDEPEPPKPPKPGKSRPALRVVK